MIRAFWKARKVKVIFEKEIDDWDVKHTSAERIVSSMQHEIKNKIIDEIMNDMRFEISDKIKKEIVEEMLSNKTIREGIEEHLREKIKASIKDAYY